MSPRVYHHYAVLEETKAGLWRIPPVDQRDAYVEAAARLMRDFAAFRDAMCLAVTDWPNSMAAAMTTPSLNRQAWMGHAGCCIATGSPESLTRLGWHTLTQAEQDRANEAADEAIAYWKRLQAGRGGEGFWDA